MLWVISGAKFTTTNLSATIKNLAACEEYLLNVGLVGPLGVGPLTTPLSIVTSYNKNASPKRLSVERHPNDENVMIVKWKSSCAIMNEPIGYEVWFLDHLYLLYLSRQTKPNFFFSRLL